MTPAARAAAAIEILDAIIAGEPAEARLIRWARGSRFAGSGDRAAIRDIVFDCLRQRRSRAALGGSDTGRGLVLGGLRADGIDPALVFSGEGHAPSTLTEAEETAGHAPTPGEATDLPVWCEARLRMDLGGNFPAIAAALRERAPVYLRVNLARADLTSAQKTLVGDGIETEAEPHCATALRVTSGARKIQASAAWAEGLVELQDLSPQIACAALRVGPGLRVLDYCAGGGGKALALAARGAAVTAWDLSAARLRDLPNRAKRAGAAIRVANAPPSDSFDLVVADVPCSGSGTWRRTPDAKWRLTPDELQRLLETQAEILDAAAARVAPGGTLAYMTCSLLAAENEAQVAQFLLRRPEFTLTSQLRMTPLTASDGFFVAELHR